MAPGQQGGATRRAVLLSGTCLHEVAACGTQAQHSTTQHGTARQSTTHHSTAQQGRQHLQRLARMLRTAQSSRKTQTSEPQCSCAHHRKQTAVQLRSPARPSSDLQVL